MGVLQCRDQRRRRQIIKHQAGRVEEQRQIVFNAAGSETLADVPVDSGAGGVAFKTGPVALAKATDGRRRKRKLPGGQQRNRVVPVKSSLGIGVKSAQTFNFVIEEVKSAWRLAAHRIEVQQGTAHCKLPVLFDLRHPDVAGGVEASRQVSQIHPVTNAELLRTLADICSWRQPLQQSAHGDHDESTVEISNTAQALQAARNDVLVG